MTVELKYAFGSGEIPVRIPNRNLLGILQARFPRPLAGAELAVAIQAALRRPIASPPLASLARPDSQVAVLVPDISRPCPTAGLLPPILAEFAGAGIKPDNVTIVVALGNHRPLTAAERWSLVGAEIAGRYRCVDSDPGDCFVLGRTARGTPVEITRLVAAADLVVAVGSIEPHYFAGFTGGAKALLPGVASRQAIEANHRLLLEPGAKPGLLDGNPVREDIEEAGRIGRLAFILNAVVDERQRAVALFGGHPRTAHRAGCDLAGRLCRVDVPVPAPIVVAGAGGRPRDLNLYQAHKALENSRAAAIRGGTVILVAECAEGFGNRTFEDWALASGMVPGDGRRLTPDHFRLGGHKAAALARILDEVEVILVSRGIDPGKARRAGLIAAPDPGTALELAFARLGDQAPVWAVPWANVTWLLNPSPPSSRTAGR